MGHGLKDSIVEFNGPGNQEGGVGSLGRHGGRGVFRGRVGRGVEGAVDGVINQVVRSGGIPLGREGGIELRQRELLIQMSGDQAQPLRRLFGRQVFRYAGNARGVPEKIRRTKATVGDRRDYHFVCSWYRPVVAM